MALNVPDWRTSLDRSLEAVFGSFYATLFCAPLIVLYTVALQRTATHASSKSSDIRDAPLGALIANDFIVFAIQWAVSLFVLVMLARAMGARRRVGDLIIGFNWTQPITLAALLPGASATAAAGNADVGMLFVFPGIALAIALLWGVIRRGLDARPAQAIAILVMLLLIGVLIDVTSIMVLQALFGGAAAGPA